MDFDLSPGTSVGRDPMLVYQHDTGVPAPIVEFTVTSDSSLGVPLRIELDFTFDGTAQATVTFQTTGHSAGDTYLLAAQDSAASTGAYSWSATIRTVYSAQTDTDTPSGTAYAVVHAIGDGIGNGWSLSGVDRLVSISGGVLWVYGSGGFRIFTGTSGTLTSPANDFGTLVKNANQTATPS